MRGSGIRGSGVEALRAEHDRLVTQFEQGTKRLAALRERLAGLRGRVESDQGLVRVGVGASGELLELEIAARAYRRFSPIELAAEILTLAAQAREKARAEVAALLAPLLPAGVPVEQVLRGEANWGDLTPPWSER